LGLPQRRLAFRRTEREDPVADAQLDVAVRALFEEGSPMRVLVVVIGMRRVGMKVDEHGCLPEAIGYPDAGHSRPDTVGGRIGPAHKLHVSILPHSVGAFTSGPIMPKIDRFGKCV